MATVPSFSAKAGASAQIMCTILDNPSFFFSDNGCIMILSEYKLQGGGRRGDEKNAQGHAYRGG